MTAVVFTVLNAWLLTVRIRAENAALATVVRGMIDLAGRRRRAGGPGDRPVRRAGRTGGRRRWRPAPDPIDKACGEGLMPGAVQALATWVWTCGHAIARHPVPGRAPIGHRVLRRWARAGRAAHALQRSMTRRATRARRAVRAELVSDVLQDGTSSRRRPTGPVPRGRRRAALAHPADAGPGAPAGRSTAVGPAPALPDRALDPDGRGLLGRPFRGLRDAGRPGRGRGGDPVLGPGSR